MSLSIVEGSPILSPNGRYLAYVTAPTKLPDQPSYPPEISGPGPVVSPVQVTGHVVVVDVASGRTVISRAVHVLVSETVPTAWSPDGDYVFLPSSFGTIEAVPAFSPTAPVSETQIAPVSTRAGFSSEELMIGLAS